MSSMFISYFHQALWSYYLCFQISRLRWFILSFHKKYVCGQETAFTYKVQLLCSVMDYIHFFIKRLLINAEVFC